MTVVQQVVVPAVVALDLPGDALLGSWKRQDPLDEQQEKSMKQASPLENYIYIVIFSHILSATSQICSFLDKFCSPFEGQ